MKYGSKALSACAISLVLLGFGLVPASSQDKPLQLQGTDTKSAKASTAKPQCIGCSIDGKTTPRTRDGHPDFSGFWDNPFESPATRSSDGSVSYNFGGGSKKPPYGISGHAPGEKIAQPEYKPEYAAKINAIVDGQYGASTPLDPQYDCKPLGVPRTMESPFQIVQTALLTTVLYEGADKASQNFRIIYTDGRQHPADLDTTYLGHSVGHWMGNILVVDVAGLNDETWLGGGQTGEKFALIHSDQEHVVERYSRNGDVLTYEATIDDPVMFTKPWEITPRHFIHAAADDELFESFCDARDKNHIIQQSDKDKFICNYCTTPPKQ